MDGRTNRRPKNPTLWDPSACCGDSIKAPEQTLKLGHGLQQRNKNTTNHINSTNNNTK